MKAVNKPKASKELIVNVITEGTKLTTLIKSIANRSKLLDRDLHVAGVSALYHAYTHRSTAPMVQLIEALGKSSRKGALKKWAMHFGCFMLKEDGKTWGIENERQAQGFDAVKADAIATPFWALTPDSDDMDFVDAMAQVRALLKRLGKAKEQGKLDAEGLSVLGKLASVAPAVV